MARTCDGGVGNSRGVTLFSMRRGTHWRRGNFFLGALGLDQRLAAPGDELPDQKLEADEDRRREVDEDQPPGSGGFAARRFDVPGVKADDEISDRGDDDKPCRGKP